MRGWTAPLAAACVALVLACASDYGAAVEAEPGADAGPPPADAAAPVADAGDAEASAEGACRAPRAPSCEPAQCAQRELHASAGGYPFGIATDAAYVYWLEQRAPGDAYNGTGTATLLRTKRDGGGAPLLLASSQAQATALALAGGFLYWATYDPSPGGPHEAHLRRVSASCTPPCAPEDVTGAAPLVGKPIVKIVPFGGDLLLAVQAGPVLRWLPGLGAAEIEDLGFAPDVIDTGGGAYATGEGKPYVLRIPRGPASVTKPFWLTPLDGGAAGLHRLATDCTHLFGLRGPSETLYRAPLDGGALEPIGVGPSATTYDLGADARWLYAASPNAGGLAVLDPQTGTRVVLASGNVFALAVDDDGVYWGDHDGTGKLRMMVK